MPIYEYQCPDCGTEFQKLVYGQTAVVCPSCQSPEVRRTLSLFGIRGSSRPVASEGGGGACCGPGGCGCQ
ncbi:MAG: zinc ribbon domain-containing protein [Candidatus Rokubacteria bacterium]|nr:zinc ribbon domain-containing protein [Candidatus Rokubacteria bacterium]